MQSTGTPGDDGEFFFLPFFFFFMREVHLSLASHGFSFASCAPLGLAVAGTVPVIPRAYAPAYTHAPVQSYITSHTSHLLYLLVA